jgi:hypothetical protein
MPDRAAVIVLAAIGALVLFGLSLLAITDSDPATNCDRGSPLQEVQTPC